MDKQQTADQRPGDAERPQESGAAAPGRGGRMSRQRKTAGAIAIDTITATWTKRSDAGCRAARGNSRRAGSQSLPWRRPSQGLGPAATPRHTHLTAARAAADAGERVAGANARRLAAWTHGA